jgi:hypothetical protein
MPRHRQGITTSDLEATRLIFQARGLPLTERRFRYRASTDRWVVSHLAAGVETVIARCRDDTGWTEV